MTMTDVIEQGTTLYNKGDAEGFCAFYGSGAVLTTPDGRFTGGDEILAYVQGLMAGFPGLEVTIGRHCEEGGRYFGEFTLRGVHTAPLPLPDGTEVPPTHKSFEIVGMEIAVGEGDRIVQHDMVWDNMTLLAQLGLMGG